MDPLLIVKTGTTLASLTAERGDFEDWICAGMGVDRSRAKVVAVFDGDALPDPDDFAGVVVTGSSAMVSHREAWSESAAGWLRAAVTRGVPVLGICYGHQLLAHALGGHVGPNPCGRQIGTVQIQLAEATRGDALLAGFGDCLRGHTTHAEVVLALPDGAVRLGSNHRDRNAVFSYGAAAWGVQFHPEFDTYVMKRYIEERRELLASEDIDADSRIAAVEPCPAGTELLRSFARLIGAPSHLQPARANT